MSKTDYQKGVYDALIIFRPSINLVLDALKRDADDGKASRLDMIDLVEKDLDILYRMAGEN